MTTTSTLTQQRSLQSFLDIPVLFVTSLFEPLLEPAQRQMDHIREDGLRKYLWQGAQNVGQYVKQHPKECVMLFSSALMGWTDIEEALPLLPYAVSTVACADQIRSVVGSSEIKTGPLLTKRNVEIVLYSATAIYVLSLLPTAAAHDFDTLAEAKAMYKGNKCSSEEINLLLGRAKACLSEGKSMRECQNLLTDQATNDFFVFTRHPSPNKNYDPVSVVKVDQGKTCVLTALRTQTAVTKTCFSDIRNPSSRQIELVKRFDLSKAHEGLEPGQSIRHIGIGDDLGACGSFHPVPSANDLGEKPLCVLTAFGDEKDVSQFCLNPEKPEAITLKHASGVEIDRIGGEPVSVVINNPKSVGLDTSCSTAKGPSLFEALSAWWHQKPSCET